MPRKILARLAVFAAFATASLAEAPRHPLDGLSAKEHWVVYDALRQAGHLSPDTRFAGVFLEEPEKGIVLAWKAGEPLRRRAKAILVVGSATYEAVVDLDQGRLVSWNALPAVQAPFRSSEYEIQDTLAKSDPRVVAALQKRGYSDLNTLACEGNTPGYFGTTEEQSGHRFARATCYDLHGNMNFWARPIGGFTIVMDLTDHKVLDVIDLGPMAPPTGRADYDPEGVGPVRGPLPPLLVEQPQGPAFKIDGSEIAWSSWRFHLRLDPRRGQVFSEVRYQDGARTRPVLYQGSLSELFVPYMDPDEGWYWRTYLDAGEFGPTSGLAGPRGLIEGADCPRNAAYVGMVMANERGLPERHDRMACIFERAGGEVSWRHSEEEPPGLRESRPRRDLVVRLVATLGNYDYIFDWIFEEDGSIRVAVGATGIVQVKGVASRDALAKGGAEDSAYGRFVAPHAVAVNHDHFFCFRLDLDVDGRQNSLVVDELKTKRLGESSRRKSVWVVEPRTARTEAEGELDTHTPSLWRIVNPNVKGPLGYPTSYEIKASHGADSLFTSDDWPQKRAGFINHALWITPYRPDELFAAGDYTSQSRGGDGLPRWSAENRPIENTDIVAWYVFGMHHVVRAEDWPIMPTVWHEFELRPYDFFPENPVLNLPRVPC